MRGIGHRPTPPNGMVFAARGVPPRRAQTPGGNEDATCKTITHRCAPRLGKCRWLMSFAFLPPGAYACIGGVVVTSPSVLYVGDGRWRAHRWVSPGVRQLGTQAWRRVVWGSPPGQVLRCAGGGHPQVQIGSLYEGQGHCLEGDTDVASKGLLEHRIRITHRSHGQYHPTSHRARSSRARHTASAPDIAGLGLSLGCRRKPASPRQGWARGRLATTERRSVRPSALLTEHRRVRHRRLRLGRPRKLVGALGVGGRVAPAPPEGVHSRCARSMLRPKLSFCRATHATRSRS